MFRSDKNTINLAIQIQIHIFIDSLAAQKPNSLIERGIALNFCQYLATKRVVDCVDGA